MIILVCMSSMKFLQKIKIEMGASEKKPAHTESLSLPPLVVRVTWCTHNILVPNVLSSANAWTLSHPCDRTLEPSGTRVKLINK